MTIEGGRVDRYTMAQRGHLPADLGRIAVKIINHLGDDVMSVLG